MPYFLTTLYPTLYPYTLYPIPYTLYPIPYTLCPIPYALCPMRYALCAMPYMPYTLTSPSTLYPLPSTIRCLTFVYIVRPSSYLVQLAKKIQKVPLIENLPVHFKIQVSIQRLILIDRVNPHLTLINPSGNLTKFVFYTNHPGHVVPAAVAERHCG